VDTVLAHNAVDRRVTATTGAGHTVVRTQQTRVPRGRKVSLVLGATGTLGPPVS
jgi:hypothetical protein